jgi:site-specific DNA-methyltransferase (adenine-specific)
LEFDKLYNEDCIVGMGRIPSGTIDLAFADPPFNIGYKYDVYEDRRAADEYLDWTRQWGRQVVRALKPTGTFWLAIGDDFAAEAKMIFQRELGLFCRSWVIWYYTFGVNCKYKFSRSHTHLFHFVKDPKSFTFNRDSIRVPSARQLVYADVRAHEKGRLPDDTWILRPQDASNSFTPEEDVWYFPRVCGTFKERAGWHGCQMPEQLLGRIITVSSNPGDTVLEPFGGSGTTLVVAKKLQRRFIGFELSKNYAEQIQLRLNNAKASDPLYSPQNPKTTAPPTHAGKQRRKQRLQQPSSQQQQPSSQTPVSPSPGANDKGISEAFTAIRNGYPVDRVIADPALNEQFINRCRQLGLSGTAFDWNHRLMHLRKAGRFKALPASTKTELEFEENEYDRYRFACEIAVQHFEEEGNVSLDHMLCDPELARGFDQYVLAMLPDSPNPFKIRWFALRIRKAANYIARTSGKLESTVSMPREPQNPFQLSLNRVPSEPGLYWLSGEQKHLYVGETANLRERFRVQFEKGIRFDFWGTPRNHLQLAFRPVTASSELLSKHQSRWISQWQPIGNYKKLAMRGGVVHR